MSEPGYESSRDDLVLVTGGTGFIGGWAVAELLHRGYRVRATLRDPSRAEAVRQAAKSVSGPGNSADQTGRLEFATADLSGDTGWVEAMAGVTYVLHVATPMGLSYGPGTDPEEAVVRPAVEGTRRVVEAAATAGVRRVVLTSAANTASPSSYQTEGVSDETLWTDPDDPTLIPYRRAKTLAERTAWELADRQGAPELVTVLPGAVFGPVLTASAAGSVDIIARMLTGKMPRVPRIGLEVVDVRDLVDLHLRAMLHPDAAGQRFLGTGEFVWMRDIAQALKSGLGSQAGRVSTRGVPDFAVRLAARRNPALREIAPGLGRKSRHSTAKAERILG
jgi:dihydroflavonol-4-reductase